MNKITKKVLFLFIFTFIIVLGIFLMKSCLEFYYKNAYPIKYNEYVDKYSYQYNIDKDLVYSVIYCESGFNPNVISSVGARGLMQVMSETFDWAKTRMDDKRNITFDDMFDPEINIQYGTFILSLLLDEFKIFDSSIAAYHAGWGKVKQWLSESETSENGIDLIYIPFKDTNQYVKKVNKVYFIYKSLY